MTKFVVESVDTPADSSAADMAVNHSEQSDILMKQNGKLPAR